MGRICLPPLIELVVKRESCVCLGVNMSNESTPARKKEWPVDYVETLQRMATAVRSANIRAPRKINAELINLYWSIGNIILERQSI